MAPRETSEELEPIRALAYALLNRLAAYPKEEHELRNMTSDVANVEADESPLRLIILERGSTVHTPVPTHATIANCDSSDDLEGHISLLWNYVDAIAELRGEKLPSASQDGVSVTIKKTRDQSVQPIHAVHHAVMKLLNRTIPMDATQASLGRFALEAPLIEGFQERQEAALRTRLAILARNLGVQLEVKPVHGRVA